MTQVRIVEDNEENEPIREEIEKRAYELYLESGVDGHAVEHWLLAEEELRQEQGKRREPIASPLPVKRTASAS